MPDKRDLPAVSNESPLVIETPPIQRRAPVALREPIQAKGLSKRERQVVEEIRVQSLEVEGTQLIGHQVLEAQDAIIEHAHAGYAATTWRINTRNNYVAQHADAKTVEQVGRMSDLLQGLYANHKLGAVEEIFTQLGNTLTRERYVPRKKRRKFIEAVVDGITDQ